ncbi:hypothetical protein BDV28DRAFT_142157 [Aspergillus coremiiformis]|uniref:Uncharacterized protein n=1 Tax=Aspergillus coremiiformis TaxID=138285 RepID=A0A5N6YU33_9EURO|nr:hypothetical protein BDV28DRAFT_142157 [Aspergillus coremiiformis]
MSVDQSFYSMGHSLRTDEWNDFDNFFEGYVESNPTSVNSISPKDLDLTYNDMDGSNWDSGFDLCTQIPFTDSVNPETPFQEYVVGASNAEPVADPNDLFQLPPTSPNDLVLGSDFNSAWLPDAQDFDDHFYSTIRHMVESQAAVDSRCSSKKEKRREAAIALHLQRLQDAPFPEIDMSSDSNTSFPSPTCASPATTPLSDSTNKSSTPPSADATPGGIELVLDLNMNTPANLPRKQKPRSRAQKENYIKVRKHGACEKHRKQHKRCNCLDITGSGLNVNKTAIFTSPAVLDSIRQTSTPLHGPSQARPRPVSLPEQTQSIVLPTNVQPPKTMVMKHTGRDVRRPPQDNQSCTAPLPLNVYHGRHAAGSLPKPVETANTGQPRPRAPQSYRPTASCGGVDKTPSAPGPQMPARLKTFKSPVTTSRQQFVMELEACPKSAVNHMSGGSHRTITWRFRQVTQQSSENVIRTQSSRAEHGSLLLQLVSTSRSSNVSSQQIRVAYNDSSITSRQLPIERFSFTLSNHAPTATSILESFLSWIGASLFGRLAVFAFKQHWFTGKGMGLS